MSNALWIAAACGAVLVGMVYLRQRRARRQFLKATAIVRLTNELWEVVNAVPPGHLSAPLREAVTLVFTRSAEVLDVTPLAVYGATLAERAARVQQLPRLSAPQLYEGASERFVRLAELLDRAHEQQFLPKRQHALARVAAGLSAELSDIDGLCVQAERALTLKSVDEALSIRSQALRACNRLPTQTAQEVRRRIEARLPLADR